MQATAVQAPPTQPAAVPPAPAAPTPAPTPAGVIVMNPDGSTTTLPIPQTSREVEAIKDRRSELSSQLNSAEGRRNELAEELKTMPPGPARTGIEQRLGVLDRRLAQLEADIAATGRQLTAASPGIAGTAEGMPMQGGISENELTMGVVFTLFVLAPLALTYARTLWKRGSRPAAAPPSPETNERLERLEQGVEAIAIEIERVSEGQRFVTKLLSEGAATGRLPESVRSAERV